MVEMEPSNPGSWDAADRRTAFENALVIAEEYESLEFQEHFNVLRRFKDAHGEDNYARDFLEGKMTFDEYSAVSHSRRWLNKWWKVVGRRYDDRQLIWDGDDFFKAGGKWLRAGTAYRLLAEPIDISNWYKCRIHDPSTGDNYNGHYADATDKRPSHYSRFQKLYERSGIPAPDSLAWAHKLKDLAENNLLVFQTTADAKDGKGFSPLSGQMDGLCVCSWDFGRLQSWPAESTVVRCSRIDGKLKVASEGHIMFDISLDRLLRDRTLLVELTLPNIVPGKLFEATFRAEEDNVFESLVLGKPDRKWSWIQREVSANGDPRVTSLKLSTSYETGAAEKHTMCLVVDVGDRHVSCLRDGVQLREPVGVAQLASVREGNDMQIILRNWGTETIDVHKVELWATANWPAAPATPLTPRTTLDVRQGFGPSAPQTPTGYMSGTPAAQMQAPPFATAPDISKDTAEKTTVEAVAHRPESAPSTGQSSGAESRTTAALTTGTTEALTPPVDLGKDRIPPAWGKGVDYVLDEPPAWTIPGHDLPKPVADKQRLHPDGGWPFPASKSKSTPMQVNFGTLVYKGPRKTFLVVAAVVSSGGAMVHTVESTEGLRCGYFQESIEVTMRPTADNITRSPKGTFPQNVVGEAVLLEKTVETGNTAAAGLNLGVTVNPATGTAVGPALTTSFARSKKETDKTSGVARAWLAPVFKSDGAKLTWTAELGMYRDGTEYVTSMGKDAQGKLRDVPDFVKGDVGIEVQGTWELPKELREVTVELSVKQVLRYSALKGWPRKELKHFDDHNGPQTKVIEVNTVLVGPNVQKSTSDALPFWEG